MSIDVTYANKVLDYMLGTGHTGDFPATVYLRLTVSGTEVAGNNYSRVAITNNTTNFPAASGGTKSNGTFITFPLPSGSWGQVDGADLMDASTSGKVIIGGTLNAEIAPDDGSAPFADAGDLTFTLGTLA